MIEVKNGMRGSEFWLNSSELSFSQILTGSRVPAKWSKYSLIEEKYRNSIVKPVNRYVSNLYPRPEILSINNNTVKLRQKTHAEIWVDIKSDDLYALDKCHQRQFYPSENKIDDPDSFEPTYKFYMPWIIDLNSMIEISPAGDCFYSEKSIINTKENDIILDFIDVPFIDFKIKRFGAHMKNSNYGIIEIGTPMYDITLNLNDKDLEKINEQYR
jgi:hypothetical protein